MALPYPMSPVSPFDVITSQAENEKIANIESLADGTGIDDGAITATKIDFATLAFGNYSTSEEDTGFKFTDGKTIYKRTFAGTITHAANSRNGVTLLSGVDSIVDSSGFVRQSPTGEEVNIGSLWTGVTGAQYASVWTGRTSAGAAILYSVFADPRTNAPYSVTILYTKI